ncbi:MAG: bifunctional acetate--CoA ligase family protein/GNAT family N-acetyltransferase [Bryobacteraceae bacterium]|nr:bifunctional acetate--CoA ligase family protein/GNAT family N-acetyltransferase [Bryobacteraceae bacterium]
MAASPTKFSSVLYLPPHPLDVFFKPSNVAVIGATEHENSVGRTTLWNLISSPFGGTVFPVNPKRSNVLGIKAYPSIREVPERVDLAVVITPAKTVPQVIRECGECGVKGAVVISAGFKELGPEGAALENEVLAEARRSGLRLIGPNCLGVMSPLTGLNATFARGVARAGSVAFLSQSGALMTSILDWSFQQNVGFSAFVSIGSMIDVDWGDLISYLGRDPRTRSILIYMESIGNARSFLSAAREVALSKPIIVIKAGRTAQGGQAAASHTGAMTGSDDVLDAAFRRVGVLRVNNISDLFSMAEALDKQPRPRGPRLTILTNAGGPAVLATDALIGSGGELAELAPQTIEALNQFLPRHWSHRNPIDIIGDADPERYARSVEVAAKDPASDGLLVILTPQDMTDPTRTAELMKPFARVADRPVLASWMGGSEVAAGDRVLTNAGIPTFNYPDTAVRAFQYMWSFANNLRAIYETPVFTDDNERSQADHQKAAALLERVAASGRTLLTEYESKQILDLYGIPTVRTELASSPAEAVRAAEAIGYPAVLKLNSETITHKSDVGGIELNLRDEAAVRQAFDRIRRSVEQKAGPGHFQGVSVQPMVKLDGYELIVGSSADPQFGPVLLFGAGGQLVEVFEDRALGLPPLTSTLARRMMEQTRIFKALCGVRGRPPVKIAEVEQLMVRFSQLVAELCRIREIDINPLLCSPERILALDARIVLYDADVKTPPRTAIRAYPVQYVAPWTTRNGLSILMRPIRPEDEPLIRKFHEGLSERSVYMRYLQSLRLSQRVAHDRLTRICFNDYDREIALVALTADNRVIAVGRVQKIAGTDDAEIALLVSDEFQGHGLGAELTRRLIEVARKEGVKRMVADVLSDNRAMQVVFQRQGFRFTREPGDPALKAELVLS